MFVQTNFQRNRHQHHPASSTSASSSLQRGRIQILLSSKIEQRRAAANEQQPLDEPSAHLRRAQFAGKAEATLTCWQSAVRSDSSSGCSSSSGRASSASEAGERRGQPRENVQCWWEQPEGSKRPLGQLALGLARTLGAALERSLRAAWARPPEALASSKQKLELLSAFCLSFLAYQLETWRLLVDGAGEPSAELLCSACQAGRPMAPVLLQARAPRPAAARLQARPPSVSRQSSWSSQAPSLLPGDARGRSLGQDGARRRLFELGGSPVSLPSSRLAEHQQRAGERDDASLGRQSSLQFVEPAGRRSQLLPPEQSRRSPSPSKLSLAGAKRRLGFKSQKGLSSLSVQRSEEVAPAQVRHLVRQSTFNSLATDSGNDTNSLWLRVAADAAQPADPRTSFIEGLGPGQIVSRQALVSPRLGDIQLSLSDRRGQLEVEVVRARHLLIRSGSKGPPAPYVKVYLTKEKKCIAKRKTQTASRSLDPLYQQVFTFQEDYANCLLQVIVWGDYGRRERKSLMGIAQISLDKLNLSSLVIGWFRLFNAPSLAGAPVASKTLRHTLSASVG